MNLLKKIVLGKPFIIATAAILTYTLAGFLLTPYLVKRYVPGIVQKELKKQASIGAVRVNPYLFTFEANAFRMDEPDGQPIANFKRLFVDFELKSLFKWAWTFREIRLEEPALNAVIDPDGRLNLADLAPSSDASPPQDENGQPPRLILENIRIDRGRIDFSDRRQSEPASITFEPMNLRMKNLSTLPDQAGPKSITAASGAGETFKWTGTLGLNPLVTKGNFSIENLRAETLWDFARDSLDIEPPVGKLSLSSDYSVDLGQETPRVVLTNLSIAITDILLRLQGTETPFLELPDTRISGGRFDLTGRRADIALISVKGGRTRLAVDADGALNLQQIVRTSEAASSLPSPPTPDIETKPWKLTLNALDVDAIAVDYEDLSRTPGLKAGVGKIKVGLKAEAEAGTQIQGRINDIALAITGFEAGFSDGSQPAVQIDTLSLAGGAYDIAANRLTAAAISIEGGSIDVRRQTDGGVNLALLAAPPAKGAIAKQKDEAAVEGHPFQFLIKSVSLSDIKAAFSDLTVQDKASLINLDPVSVAVFDVDGKSPMKFNLDLKVQEGGRIKAGGIIDPSVPSVESAIEVAEFGLLPLQPYIDRATALVLTSGAFSTRGNLRHGFKTAGAQTFYQGGFKIDHLQVAEVGGSEPLVGWQSVQSEQLKLQLEPDGIDIGDIHVLKPIGKVIIEADGTLNLAKAVRSDVTKKAEKPTPPDTAASFPYRVRRVLLSDGTFDFADLNLPIPFGTKIHELKGTLAGISATPNARAQVKLDGRVDDYGTAKVDGELDTSDPKAFTDIDVVFRNVEMSRLTPYSGKFAGRRIDSGKLSVDLNYKIDKSRLTGENKIVVERLTLGEKVESPDAVNLPLNLAIALLEDANGVIDLGLPVRGNLDSPEFSFGALIGKAIINLLTKIVTSPFRALAALIPGAGEEAFKNVAFEPGSAGLPPPEKEKLAVLAEALQKRPQLKLAVRGRYHPETDRAVLRSAALGRTLATRLGQSPAPDRDPGPVDYSSPETGQALAALFSERFGIDALHALEAELKAEEEKIKTETAAADKTGAPRGAGEDPGRLAKRLFLRLAEVEPVDDAELVRLADARAKAVIAELSGPREIPAERLEPRTSAALQPSDPVTAELILEVLR